MTKKNLDILIAKARKVTLSSEQKEEQRRSFAYGNANIENSAVTRKLINTVADKLRVAKRP